MWMILLTNGISVICWTVLAVVFNKWWIALFAILFLSSTKIVSKAYKICDLCGKHSPYAKDHNAALEKATKAGWISKRVGDKIEDYCPECQAKLSVLKEAVLKEQQNSNDK